MPTPGSCPACARPVGPKDRLCTGCGHNLTSGEKTATEVGQTRAGPGILGWIWHRMLGMFGCLVLTIVIAAAGFFVARGDPVLTDSYTTAVIVASCITVGLLAVAIVQSEGIGGLITFWAHDRLFWYSDSTDGRLKGVLAGLAIAGILIIPLRAALPAAPAGPATNAAAAKP